MATQTVANQEARKSKRLGLISVRSRNLDKTPGTKNKPRKLNKQIRIPISYLDPYGYSALIFDILGAARNLLAGVCIDYHLDKFWGEWG